MVGVFLSVDEVARQLRLEPRTVRRLIRRGEIPAVKVGKQWRVPADALAGLRAEARAAAAEPLFMTTEEFLRLPVENLPVQLVKGLVVRDPAPFVPHQVLVGRLHILLHRGVEEAGEGMVLLSPTDVVLSHDTVLQPDLLAVRRERLHIVGKRVEGPPDLVVEVEAEHTRERDLTVKRMLYAKHGIPEMWYASGSRRLLIQFVEPIEDDYRLRVVHTAPARVESRSFPGLVADLDQVFRGYGAP